MIRFLFWVLIGFVVLTAIRRLGGQRPGVPPLRRQPHDASSSEMSGESMVSCCVCRLNVPQSEAIPVHRTDGNRVWACCIEHARRVQGRV
jgi:hypothetical protein